MNLSSENETFLQLISDTLTDHASGQKAWNAILEQRIKKEDGTFFQFFCNTHRNQIGSREFATAIRSIEQNEEFASVKKSQQQYDDFKAMIYQLAKKVKGLK